MTKESKIADDDHVVIKFRPRTAADAARHRADQQPAPAPASRPGDLSHYERTGETDDYRHRMRMNIAAGLFTVALIGFGVWLAMSIADLRRTQDCILYGRRDCAVIPQPAGK